MGFYGPYRPLDASAVVLFIKGTAHCWDMHDDINMTQIKEAQEVIFANVKKWVGHEVVEGGLTFIPGQHSQHRFSDHRRPTFYIRYRGSEAAKAKAKQASSDSIRRPASRCIFGTLTL